MASRRATTDRLVQQVTRLCARAQDPLCLLEQVARLVRPQVPYEDAGWILVDPDTMLINGVYAENVDRDAHLALIEAEMSDVEDVNRFVDLARQNPPAASLSGSTDGDLTRSARWRSVYQPHGYGDELRATFTDGGTTWGHACMGRLADEPFFDRHEVELVARICPHVAHGIRTGLALCGTTPASSPHALALVVLTDDGRVESMTPTAEQWFGDPEDESMRSTIVLHQVAQQARALAGGATGPPARAWARTRDGASVIVRGTRLDAGPDGDGGVGTPRGRVALVLDPATRADIAPLLMELHQLTDRERQVTQLLLTGMTTRSLADQLWISPETLRGHVKSILAKLGVSSRAELFAMLSHEPRSRLPRAEPAAPRTR